MTRTIAACLLALSSLSAAQGTQTFTGVITDDMCAAAGHARMRMGPTDGECTRACVIAHDARYVLYDGQEVYGLSDQQTPEKLAGEKVTVVGILDASKTIRVEAMRAAN